MRDTVGLVCRRSTGRVRSHWERTASPFPVTSSATGANERKSLPAVARMTLALMPVGHFHLVL